jgi:hypothetical protein
MRGGPDFIGIGPGRCGTDWVWRVLQATPGVWMTPIKELHYWDRRDADGGPSLRWNTHLRNRARSNLGTARRRMRGRPAPPFEPRFDVRYFTGRATPRWYGRLFEPAGPDALAGEITPSYLYMSSASVEELAAAFPSVRVFVTLRNPLDRLWSVVAKGLVRDRGRVLEQVPEDELLQFALDRQISYHESLATWFRYLGREQVAVLWFDDLLERPADYLASLFRHLGIDPALRPTGELTTTPINTASLNGPRAPEGFRARLAAAKVDDLDRLQELIGPHPHLDRWRAELGAARLVRPEPEPRLESDAAEP